MGLSDFPPLRSLPRTFVPGANPTELIILEKEEVNKLRKVLRLGYGALIGVLPNDGTLVVCEFKHEGAVPLEQFQLHSEPPLRLTLAQALPKGDKLDEIVRACTEAGVSRFLLFPSERTVVKWDAKKQEERLRRLDLIAMEACEVSFRTRLPDIEFLPSLAEVLKRDPDAVVLSEVEGIPRPLAETNGKAMTVVIGPEGGWAPREVALIGDRGVTLGPRVLRVDHAGLAAAAILLLSKGH